jgi:hypothetical protein
MRIFTTCTLKQILLPGPLKQTELNFQLQNSKGDLSVDGRMIFRQMAYEGVNWIHLAHVTVNWGVLVNTVNTSNIRFPKRKYIDLKKCKVVPTLT